MKVKCIKSFDKVLFEEGVVYSAYVESNGGIIVTNELGADHVIYDKPLKDFFNEYFAIVEFDMDEIYSQHEVIRLSDHKHVFVHSGDGKWSLYRDGRMDVNINGVTICASPGTVNITRKYEKEEFWEESSDV